MLAQLQVQFAWCHPLLPHPGEHQCNEIGVVTARQAKGLAQAHQACLLQHAARLLCQRQRHTGAGRQTLA
ncbi:hypothetical protein D3C76_770790 [compost metagenome]